jgi:serine/threonine protein kinase
MGSQIRSGRDVLHTVLRMKHLLPSDTPVLEVLADASYVVLRRNRTEVTLLATSAGGRRQIVKASGDARAASAASVLAEIGVQVPRVLDVRELTDGRFATVYEYVEHEPVSRFDAVQWQQVALALEPLHRHGLAALHDAGVELKEFASVQHDRILDRVERLRAAGGWAERAATELDGHTARALELLRTYVGVAGAAVHSDVHPSNVLVTAHGIVLIDWDLPQWLDGHGIALDRAADGLRLLDVSAVLAELTTLPEPAPEAHWRNLPLPATGDFAAGLERLGSATGHVVA